MKNRLDSSRNSSPLRPGPKASAAKSFFSSCASGACAPLAHAEKFDLALERRLFPFAQRADDVVGRGEIFVAIELPPRQGDEVRRIQPRVLRVDRHEHLHHVVFGKAIEDHRRHREILAVEMLEPGVQREQPVLSVDRPENALALGNLQGAERRTFGHRVELQGFVAGNDDRARNRRQIARSAALLVVVDELVDLLADVVALVGLLARRDAALEQVPVHFRLSRTAADARGTALAVAQDLESDEFVDVFCRK
jgi:hypothetical protein